MRKVPQKFEMKDPTFHEFYRLAIQKMRKGEIAFLRLTRASHHNMFHNCRQSYQRSEEEKEQIRSSVGPDIFIKVTITNVGRNPKCDTQASWEEKINFFDRVRSTGKELCEEEEWSNAKTLYARCIGIFKNMPKKQKDSLTPETNAKRDEILNVLNLNVAQCLLKKKMYNDAIKHCKEALTHVKINPKAYYR